MNTKYFYFLANDKHRKTRIFQLQDEGKIIEGDEAFLEALLKIISD
jgi:hypothetical protein